ncbi:uncharacterized protein F4807DRAFT_463547 [Annulohypoxylon truncatum]|uniref:uncharacterized protein n=1 Tax=Annulohypoxylon truncatum TaxID=327061 RepID=UPI00200864CD|nr:uncharacterized protein F4807DRAFT_463547 [Annulohypoxylon truncatum]KAI1206601.1 hypothetical protein F4807DRAFT_463547 [Annulohypoxylon truncatum]
MTWQETDEKGVFSRPIGENETYIKLLGDTGLPLNREQWAINSTATIVPTGSFASTDLAAHFRRAWMHQRFQHPSLAAEVAPDDTHFIYTRRRRRRLLRGRDPDLPADALREAGLHPAVRGAARHTAHWRTDGMGVLLLLDAFLSLASGPAPLADPASLAWGTEIARLAPAIEDAAAVPKESTPELKERGAALVNAFSHVVGAVGIPYLGDAATLPAGTRSAALVLSPETTEKIVAACKARGVSVTVAVHASVAAANYVLADAAARDRHYTSTVRFALRPYLPEPYSTPAFAAALYTTGWMKRVEAGASWAEHLQSYRDEYRKGITRDYLDSHREYAAQLGELLRNLSQSGGDQPPPSDVDISSIGNAEKIIRRSYGTSEAGFEVKAVSVGVEMLSRQAATFVWTFRDQLNLSAVYNESFHSAEQMNQFVSTAKAKLLEGLGVQDS